MAKKIRDEKTHQKLFIIFMFFIFNLYKSNGSDFDLLLSFKSSLNDPINSLSNWNNNSSLPFCHWNGISCLNSSHVSKIHLPGKKISGKLSESIFHFPFLESLDLSNNQLSGGIPTNFSFSLSLKFLNLSNNNFTGPLPNASIPQLISMDLSNNLLSGEIPEGIGFFSALKFLDLGGNSFVGKFPKSVTNLTSLKFLTLASNQLVGEIPPELGLMKSLKFIYLGYNNLSGGIPEEIGELTSLNHLNLVYNNLTGEIPPSIGNLTDLRYLFLYLNKLTGSIPPSIFGLKKLISLDLSDNFLSGEIPELVGQLENLEILHLFSNNFSGKIPSGLSDLPRLQVLQLWSNKLTGEIPKTLGKQSNLSVLDLSTNNLAGEIPAGLCESGSLFKLILFSNSLEGEIPNSLSHCKSLQRLRLQNNRLSGELPPEFTKLPLVYFLDISGNNLSGHYRKWEMPELEMLNLARNRFSGELPDSFGSKKLENLDLSENGFSGDIPASFGEFLELMQLNLSENELSGKIPDELSSCEKLVSLDLSNNQLIGQIPTSFSQMPVLSQLDLSMNKLSGEIPENLGEVESLVVVNISHNHFHGNLPSTGAFFDINFSAVRGNNLCGGNGMTGLPLCKKSVVKFPIWSFYVTCIVVVTVLGGVSLTIFFVRRKNEKLVIKREETEGGNWELQFFCLDHSTSITMRDILSCVRDGNFISGGNGGVLYKGKSVVNSIEFMVREMNVLSSIPSDSWKELAEIGKIRHQNIVKFVAMCRSEKGGFLVYEYVKGKILSEAIRGLNWERRRKIAVGIAEAIRYMHCQFSISIAVGDLSPENVIVDQKDVPRLRLSLLRPVGTDTKCLASSAYVAPETKEIEDISEKSDIYGFGLILIQLLTGRTPTDVEFGLQESIVEWARYCYSDCHLDTWVDPTVKGHAADNQAEIVKTMNLALRCTASDPAARPCARDITKTLESITSSSSCALGLKFSSTI